MRNAVGVVRRRRSYGAVVSHFFFQEIDRVRQRLIELGGQVQQMLASSIQAMATGDAELASRAIKSDREIDQAEMELDL